MPFSLNKNKGNASIQQTEIGTLENKSKGGNIENLKTMYTNADQFLNKKDDILQFIAGNEPNIIMISEVIPKAQMNPMLDTSYM